MVSDAMQEFNSVEAIKGAVQYGLGAAFVSSAAIAKELDLGLFKRIDISGVRLSRTLSLVSPSCPLQIVTFRRSVPAKGAFQRIHAIRLLT